jgi:hypothetical protein
MLSQMTVVGMLSHQLPGGEARALQEGAGFVGEDVICLPCSTAERMTPSAVP